MTKTPYEGDELRVDGYFYSDYNYNNDLGLAVFYRNGICFHTYVGKKDQEITEYIENEILLNKLKIHNYLNTPDHIGVFLINKKSIEFETWSSGRDVITFSQFGEIVNDSTFIISHSINNQSGNSYPENLTYRFKQFSPKPDSTTTFIE